MSHHDRIDEIVKMHLGLNEAKRPVDMGFEYIDKDMKKVKITYINPKSKGLPHWAQVGKEVDAKTVTDAEARFEVYNTDGWEVSNGYVVRAK